MQTMICFSCLSLNLIRFLDISETPATRKHCLKLGTDQWSKISNKAKEKAHDVAAELLELYAFRSIETGKIQPSDTDDYQNFISDFEYVLTRDQAKTIEDVLDDLSSNKKMDRLICGDVGFGKTEVAMRAAFISAMNGNQVVIMVPQPFLLISITSHSKKDLINGH